MQKRILLHWRKKLLKNNTYNKIENQAKRFFFKKRYLKRFFHEPHLLKYIPKTTTGDKSSGISSAYIDKVTSLYNRADRSFSGNMDSQWSEIFQSLQGDIHNAFVNNDHNKVTDILNNPDKYNHFYGFENITRQLLNNKRLEDYWEPASVSDTLHATGEAMGILRLPNPESLKRGKYFTIEELVERINSVVGIQLEFPNPFKGEYGCFHSNGIISYRAAQAIYQAWKIKELTKDISNPRILEIGAGLGRTAYYCHKMGLTDYTIVDIPMSLTAQANFLGRTLSENNIHMGGTFDINVHNNGVKLLYPELFFESTVKYDLIVNFDSLTELDKNIATEYFKKISSSCSNFYSMNHELNSFDINMIWKETALGKRIQRSLSWVRKGYAEELFQFK